MSTKGIHQNLFGKKLSYCGDKLPVKHCMWYFVGIGTIFQFKKRETPMEECYFQ